MTTPRTTFQRQVLDRLGLDICTGRYKPGQILPSESELCERFSFSRIVIREAVKSLAAKGMLEVRRKVGTLVLDPSEWNLFDPDIALRPARNGTGATSGTTGSHDPRGQAEQLPQDQEDEDGAQGAVGG